MAGQNTEPDRLVRKRIAVLADQWRAQARGVPAWVVDTRGDEIVVREFTGGDALATLHGPWAPAVGRYLAAMDPDAGRSLAELLWRIGGHGGSLDIRDAAVKLLRSLGLEESPARYRPT